MASLDFHIILDLLPTPQPAIINTDVYDSALRDHGFD